MGTSTWVRPLPVRADTSTRSALPTASTYALVPLSTTPPWSGIAVVAIAAVSHCPLGSEKAHVAIVVPSSRPGSTAACCSSEPAEARAEATRFTGRNGPGATRRPFSSATMTASAVGWPERLPPPRVSGTNSEVQPSSAASPPLSIKALGRRVQVTNLRQRGFALQERARRVPENLLVPLSIPNASREPSIIRGSDGDRDRVLDASSIELRGFARGPPNARSVGCSSRSVRCGSGRRPSGPPLPEHGHSRHQTPMNTLATCNPCRLRSCPKCADQGR